MTVMNIKPNKNMLNFLSCLHIPWKEVAHLLGGGDHPLCHHCQSEDSPDKIKNRKFQWFYKPEKRFKRTKQFSFLIHQKDENY